MLLRLDWWLKAERQTMSSFHVTSLQERQMHSFVKKHKIWKSKTSAAVRNLQIHETKSEQSSETSKHERADLNATIWASYPFFCLLPSKSKWNFVTSIWVHFYNMTLLCEANVTWEIFSPVNYDFVSRWKTNAFIQNLFPFFFQLLDAYTQLLAPHFKTQWNRW